jgi:hypothetical protein
MKTKLTMELTILTMKAKTKRLTQVNTVNHGSQKDL